MPKTDEAYRLYRSDLRHSLEDMLRSFKDDDPPETVADLMIGMMELNGYMDPVKFSIAVRALIPETNRNASMRDQAQANESRVSALND